MAISNCTYYESLVTSNPVVREEGINANGMVAAPTGPGVGLIAGPDYPKELSPYVVDQAGTAVSPSVAGVAT
jgi:hypothetical protein